MRDRVDDYVRAALLGGTRRCSDGAARHQSRAGAQIAPQEDVTASRASRTVSPSNSGARSMNSLLSIPRKAAQRIRASRAYSRRCSSVPNRMTPARVARSRPLYWQAMPSVRSLLEAKAPENAARKRAPSRSSLLTVGSLPGQRIERLPAGESSAIVAGSAFVFVEPSRTYTPFSGSLRPEIVRSRAEGNIDHEDRCVLAARVLDVDEKQRLDRVRDRPCQAFLVLQRSVRPSTVLSSATPTMTVPLAVLAIAAMVLTTVASEDRSRLKSSVLPSGCAMS